MLKSTVSTRELPADSPKGRRFSLKILGCDAGHAGHLVERDWAVKSSTGMRPAPSPKKATKPKKRMMRPTPYTLADFNSEFPDDDVCQEYIKEQRWPTGVTYCVKCGQQRRHHRVTGRTAYACDNCGNHIYPLAGTIFAKSTTPLKAWFYAIYLMSSTDCSITAKQLEREIGVTYKTAWRLFREIRRLMVPGYLQQGIATLQLSETSKINDPVIGRCHDGILPVVSDSCGEPQDSAAYTVARDTL